MTNKFDFILEAQKRIDGFNAEILRIVHNFEKADIEYQVREIKKLADLMQKVCLSEQKAGFHFD